MNFHFIYYLGKTSDRKLLWELLKNLFLDLLGSFSPKLSQWRSSWESSSTSPHLQAPTYHFRSKIYKLKQLEIKTIIFSTNLPSKMQSLNRTFVNLRSRVIFCMFGKTLMTNVNLTNTAPHQKHLSNSSYR